MVAKLTAVLLQGVTLLAPRRLCVALSGLPVYLSLSPRAARPCGPLALGFYVAALRAALQAAANAR